MTFYFKLSTALITYYVFFLVIDSAALPVTRNVNIRWDNPLNSIQFLHYLIIGLSDEEFDDESIKIVQKIYNETII